MEIIKFSKKIYNYNKLKLAINEFKEIGSFSVKNKKEFFEVRIKEKNNSAIDKIKNEFCNYLLFLTIDKKND